MKDTLLPGLIHHKTVVTTPDMGVGHLGPGHSVLSTPSMIGLMELTCLDCAQPHLDADEQTVGTMVHIWHRAAAQIGATIELDVKLVERDRRRLLFEVKCTAGDKLIGEGTHERFVLDLKKIAKVAS